MVLFETAVLLLGVAFLTFIVGEVFSYSGIGAIGSSLVIIVGGAITLTGLKLRTGATKSVSHDVVNNTTVATKTVTEFQYQTASVGEIFGVGILGSLGLGGLFMILGAAMMAQVLAGGLN